MLSINGEVEDQLAIMAIRDADAVVSAYVPKREQ
jgi:hypothetical protein